MKPILYDEQLVENMKIGYWPDILSLLGSKMQKSFSSRCSADTLGNRLTFARAWEQITALLWGLLNWG